MGGIGAPAAMTSQLSVAEAEPLAATLVSAGHSKVASAGATTTGAVVSWTVKIWEALALLPHGSVAVHVRVIVLATLQAPAASVWLNATATPPAQLSRAVTVAAAGMASHSTVASAGTPERTGATVSLTAMTCWQLATLFWLSLAVQVRVIVTLQLEAGNVAGLWLYWTRTAPSQPSMAVTVAAAGTSAMHGTAKVAAGQPLRTGAAVSETEMVWTQVALLPHASVAVQVR